MRRAHELESGVVCERCKKRTAAKQYKAIVIREPDLVDTTGAQRVSQRWNVCLDCYDIFSQYMFSFLNRQ